MSFAIVQFGESLEIVLHVKALGDILVPSWHLRSIPGIFLLEEIWETVTFLLLLFDLIVALETTRAETGEAAKGGDLRREEPLLDLLLTLKCRSR